MAGQAVIDIPRLMHESFDMPFSIARSLIAKGSVTLAGRTLGLTECQMEAESVHYRMLEVKGHGKVMTIDPERTEPPVVVKADQLELGGI